ncbi:MAG: hypothetical protein LBI38_02505 [Oscillospiraceae bacterium]|jgi:hypothetical protein|nr:hypothetical protein [Oscillospiraceae bacterium]
MFTVERLQALKKGNISVDAEKSGRRIPEMFKSATTAQKNEIIELSGLSRFGFYKASASPKVVIALAQVLNVSPHYLTGETDVKGPCDAAVLAEFFNECQSNAKKPAKRKTAAKEKAVKPAAKSKNKKSVKKPVGAKAAKTAKPVGAKTAKTAKPIRAKAAKAAKPVRAKAAKAAKPVRARAVAAEAPASAKVKNLASLDDGAALKLLEALSIRAEYDAEAAETYAAVTELLIK